MGIRDEGKNTKSIRKGNTIKVEVKTKTGVKNYIGKYLSQDTSNIYIIGYCYEDCRFGEIKLGLNNILVKKSRLTKGKVSDLINGYYTRYEYLTREIARYPQSNMEDSQRLLRLRNNAQGLSQRMYEQEHPTNMLGDVVSANLKEYINRKSKDGNFIITITNIDSGVFELRIQSEADGKLLGKVSTDRGNSQKQKEEIVREYWYTGVRKLDSSSIRYYGEIYTLFDVKEDKEGKGVVFEVSYTFTLRKDNAPDNKVKDITNYIIKNCTKRLV